MLLEDYYDAVLFKAFGVIPAEKWVDELVEAAAAASFAGIG